MRDSFVLEIGDYYLRLIDGEIGDNQIKIFNLDSLEKENNFFNTENPQILVSLANEINKIVSKSNIKKKLVNVIIPDTYTYSQIITMPYLKEKELLSAIKFQADQFIPLPIETTTIDLDILYEDKKNNQLLILIVAASNSLLDRCVSLIEEADLIPQSIENQTSCLLRLVNFINKNNFNKKSFVLINFDFFSTTFYLYDNNLNLITSVFNFKTGLDLFLKEIEINLSLERNDALNVLKTNELSGNQLIDISKIIEPAFNEFIKNLNFYLISTKEKNPYLKIEQIYTFNLNNLFFNFEKKIQEKIGIPITYLNLSDFIYKNSFYEVVNKQTSSYLSLLGGLIEG